jgi:hypothetical protein
MTTQPTEPMTHKPIDHSDITANDLTQADLRAKRDTAAKAISEILNRFSGETGLVVRSVDLDVPISFAFPGPYLVTLDIRL